MVGRGLRQGQGRGIARGIKTLYILGVLDLAQEKPLTEGPAIVRGFLLPDRQYAINRTTALDRAIKFAQKDKVKRKGTA